ncbi:MAG: FHA domain-containing protein [Pseudomonadota bacterium]
MSKLYVIGGPGEGQQFNLGDETTYIGRSSENDIQIRDGYVSRRHLRVIKRDGKTFIKDLQSKNGTIVDGKRIQVGVEVEVAEGLPIVIGMSVICLGEACTKYVKIRLDSIDMAREVYQDGMVLAEDRPMTGRKNKELMQKVSEAFARSGDLNDILEKMADYIFEILKRIDRVIIILIDSETGAVSKVVSRTGRATEKGAARYSQEVVERVIRDGESFVLSNVGVAEEAELSETLKLLKIGSVMCVPLMGEGPVRGVIYMDSVERAHGFRREDLSLFTTLSRRATSAIEKVLLRSRRGAAINNADPPI